MRATVREGGRSYPVRRYPSCLSAARPARDRAFYVPRLVLGVGTPRARNSECHSRHSFTHNACRPALRSGRGGSKATTYKEPLIIKMKGSESGGYLLSHNAVQYHRRCCLPPLPALSRARAPQARTAHTPHGAHRTP